MTTLAEFLAGDEGQEVSSPGPCECDGFCDEAVWARQKLEDLKLRLLRLVEKWDDNAAGWDERSEQEQAEGRVGAAGYSEGFAEALRVTAGAITNRLPG